MCTVLVPPGGNPIADDKYIISRISSLSTAQYSFRRKRVIIHLMNIPHKIILLRIWTTCRLSRIRLHFAEHKYTSKASVKKRLGRRTDDIRSIVPTLCWGSFKGAMIYQLQAPKLSFFYSFENSIFDCFASSVPLQCSSELYEGVKVKVKQSRKSAGVAQRVPGGLRSQISWHSAREGGEVVSLTHRPPLPPRMFLVLIFTRGWVDPRAMVRSEGICHWKIFTKGYPN
jgi:hypothetical protein